MKGKKGVIGATMAAVVATILIVIILLIFFGLSKLLTFRFVKEEPQQISLSEQSLASLGAYLRSNVDIEGQNYSVADLIRLCVLNSSYKEQLEMITETFFSGYKDYRLEIPLADFYLPYFELLPHYASLVRLSLPAEQPIEIMMYRK